MKKPDGWTWVVEPADLWEDAELVPEDQTPKPGREIVFAGGARKTLDEFRNRIKQTPPETRQDLTEQWMILRKKNPNPQGGVGLFVTDHLEMVFVFGRSPRQLKALHRSCVDDWGWSPAYFDALCDALQIARPTPLRSTKTRGRKAAKRKASKNTKKAKGAKKVSRKGAKKGTGKKRKKKT
jgi:hypothetical protein